jgi:hypothetical protein
MPVASESLASPSGGVAEPRADADPAAGAHAHAAAGAPPTRPGADAHAAAGYPDTDADPARLTWPQVRTIPNAAGIDEAGILNDLSAIRHHPARPVGSPRRPPPDRAVNPDRQA